MQQGADEVPSPGEGEAPPEPPHTRPRPRLIARIVRAASLAYLAFVLVAWALIALASDRWWPATAAMYGPVWTWPLPLTVLVPSAALFRRRSLPTLALAALVAVFPIGRLCVPWRSALPYQAAQGPFALKLRVISLNTDMGGVRPGEFKRLLADLRPDLLVLQDCQLFDAPKLLDPQWHFRRDGELGLASRHPIAGVRNCSGPEFPQFWRRPGTLVVFEINTPTLTAPVHVLNVHLATPRFGLTALIHRAFRHAAKTLDENTQWRREQSRAARRVAESLRGPVIVAGDFNTPTRSALYREHWSHWQNAFSVAGWGWGHTHFTRRTGLRIDHVLVPQDDWRVERCWVGPDVGSAHRPVIADLVWSGRPPPR
jgi:endonuclease/exonuclease/phosphatase (EEP) superfamily protein YafD